jgi:ABC-type transport system substrate-binding protein
MGGEVLLAIQESLRRVGFDCTVSISDYAAFTAEFYAKTLEQRLQEEKAEKRGDTHFIDWGSRTDAWFTLKSRLHSGVWYPDKKGSIFYRNPELDKLVDEAEVELDPQKRTELYKKAQIILANDTPLVNLWVVNKTLAKRKYVQGLQYRPVSAEISHLDAREAWLDKR